MSGSCVQDLTVMRRDHGELMLLCILCDQVFRGPTLKSDYSDYAPWGYYVIQPSDDQRENSYGY
jgi:hypothetical protein